MKKTFKLVFIMVMTCLTMHMLNAQWVRQNSGTTKTLTDVVMLDSTTAIAVGWDNTLKGFDVLGHEIETILNGHLSAGKHTVQWNAPNFASGIYFYRLQAGKASLTKKMAVIK